MVTLAASPRLAPDSTGKCRHCDTPGSGPARTWCPPRCRSSLWAPRDTVSAVSPRTSS